MAKSWGIMMFRQYFVGNRFTSWGDHQTIIPLYNDLNNLAPVRIANNHRSKIICITFTEKYLLGRNMAADDNSKHPNPNPNTHLSQPEREDLKVDDGEDVHIHEGYHGRPATPSVNMIRQAVKEDKVYKDLN